jgi:hypothetical protein
MTDEQINAAIAEACGWTDIFEHPEFGLMGVAPETHGCRTAIEDYTYDLNAMHEAEKLLKGNPQIATYVWHLENRAGDTNKNIMATHATARQRAEAFLRTLGKWEEGE